MRGDPKQAKRYARENRNSALGAMALVNQINRTKDDLESNISDMLCNLRHLCDLKGLEYYKLDECAHGHYTAEVVQARTGAEQI